MDDPAKAKCGAVGHLANHLLFTIYQSADEPPLMHVLLGMIKRRKKEKSFKKLNILSRITTDESSLSSFEYCLY